MEREEVKEAAPASSTSFPEPEQGVVSGQSNRTGEEEKRSMEEPDEKAQAKKTFLTESHKEAGAAGQSWLLNDLLFPGGKVCKLCRIPDTRSRDIKVGEILTRLKLNESCPVIVLIGNEGDQRGKLLSGAVRAAYSTDAVIVDNGLKSGIEQICYKRKVKLLGVCPEDMIVYPTKVSKGDRLGELAAGHSHMFVLGTKGDHLRWESVMGFRNDLVQRLRKGRAGPGSFVCRGLGLVVGDSPQTMNEVESVRVTQVLRSGLPILILESSPGGRDLAACLRNEQNSVPQRVREALSKGTAFLFPTEGTAEHLASAIHIHLTVSI